MRKTIAAVANPEKRVGDAPKNAEEYLARIPEPGRSSLNRIRAVIRSVVPPEATEGISYGIVTFKYKGPLIGFGAFPQHGGLYVMSPAVMKAFEKELANFDTSKGTIRFPLDRPLSSSLVKKLVKARMVENERRKTG